MREKEGSGSEDATETLCNGGAELLAHAAERLVNRIHRKTEVRGDRVNAAVLSITLRDQFSGIVGKGGQAVLEGALAFLPVTTVLISGKTTGHGLDDLI